MKLKKTLSHLKDLFTKKEPNKKYNDKMNMILDQLKGKAIQLEIQLESEENERERKKIYLKLKVINKQIRKGEKLIQERVKVPLKQKKVTETQLAAISVYEK